MGELRTGDEQSTGMRIGITLGALAIVVAIGVIDRITGPYLGLSPFYVVPVLFVAWYEGRAAGWLIALACSAAGLVADLTLPAHHGTLVPYWNAAMRLVVLGSMAELLIRLEAALRRERELAARERAAADRLRQLDQLKDTFLQTAAHDLRNPLGGIMGSALTLSRDDGTVSAEDRRLLIAGIVAMSRKMARLVDDLLDVERFKQGAVELSRVPTDVGDLVRQLAAGWEGPHHSLVVDAEPVVVSVDPVAVERIVENLLANAARHTPSGTPIWVRVEEHEGALVTVEDAGPGIPEGLRSQVFGPFARGADPGMGGVGVGLYLVGRLASLQGGRAWVEERPGGGASFKVHLPGEATVDRRVDLRPSA
jgi:signal transduction histidine kinase